jgi:hypothetical protein
VLGTVASFWAFNRIIHGVPSNQIKSKNETILGHFTTWAVPLSRLEYALILPLMISIVWLGVKPMA